MRAWRVEPDQGPVGVEQNRGQGEGDSTEGDAIRGGTSCPCVGNCAPGSILGCCERRTGAGRTQYAPLRTRIIVGLGLTALPTLIWAPGLVAMRYHDGSASDALARPDKWVALPG